jgi:hypothetical protein
MLVRWWSFFGLEKHVIFSGFIFEGFPFWEFGLRFCAFRFEIAPIDHPGYRCVSCLSQPNDQSLHGIIELQRHLL